METTRLSSKGQVILPAAVRAAKQWQPGVEFAVETTDEGVLLRPLKTVPLSRLDEVAGCLNYKGKAHTLAEMDAAITEEVRVRHARR